MIEHQFFGLNAQKWADSDGLPFSPIVDKHLTLEDIKWGIVMMLARLDEELEGDDAA